nr:class I SAM-dependent methyltransferase [candidate division Zixibacteria bacterium]
MSRYGSYEDQPILAELYDYVPGYRSRPDIDFFVRCCMESGGDIIELGSGTGRILIPVAEAGCQITGVDLSEFMLSRCREKLEKCPDEIKNRIRLIQGNIISIDLDRKFDLAIMPFRVFQHLVTVEEQLACLKNINRHLNGDDRLVFDVFQTDLKRINNPAFMNEMEDFSDIDLPDGRRLRRNHRVAAFHPEEQVNEVELIYYLTDSKGETSRIVQAFPFRYFFRYEMEHLLARAGFKILEVFGDFDRSPLSGHSPEMIFVTEKT